MKTALATWKWSFGVIAHSPLVLLALAAVVVIGLFGAYRWLWFPAESAVYLIVIGLLWALLLFAVLAGLIAVTAASALDTAATDARSIDVPSLARLSRSGWLRAAAFVVIASLISAGIHSLFSWINGYSLEVASWLTFRSEKPVAQESADAVLRWIEAFLWVVVAGFLLSFLLALVRRGWSEALRAAPRLLANACWRTHVLTGLISLLVFGGLAYLLASWDPKAPPGFLDYAQVLLRNGLSLLLAIAGFIFWLLSLARLSMHSVAPPGSPAKSGGTDPEPSLSDS